MFFEPFRNRAAAIGALCGVSVVLAAVPALAKDAPKGANKKAVCTPAYTAYKSGLEQEKAGHLAEARALYLQCAEVTACTGLAPTCQTRIDKISADMSTVVPVVTDESGAPKVDVQFKVDGRLMTSQLDGRGLPVDTGLHECTFSTDQGVIATQKILVIEGQRNRPLVVSLAKPAVTTPDAAGTQGAHPADATSSEPSAAQTNNGSGEPPAKTASSAAPSGALEATHDEPAAPTRWGMPKSAFPYLLGGVGLAGLAAGGVLTFWGNHDNTTLESQCRPSCPASSVDHIRTMYLAADVAWGVGGVALGISTLLFATSRTKEAIPTPAPVAIDVQPTRSGAVGTISGSF